MGWMLSPLANQILKTVINHTQNIQSKDFERMPYPWWVDSDKRRMIIELVESMIEKARQGKVWQWSDAEIRQVGEWFEPPNGFSLLPVNPTQLDDCSVETPNFDSFPVSSQFDFSNYP